MTILTTKGIIEATGGRLLSANSNTLTNGEELVNNFSGVSIDSRTISDGEIFFALKGPRFDGHDFLNKSLLKGNGAVIGLIPEHLPEGKAIIFVEDTIKALQDLAHFLRMRQDIPVVAITGSNGKTTTKEMAYKILSSRFKVIKNEGNLNNHIGLPLSLTRLAPDDEVAVFELGMNTIGEIRKLCDIAVPSHGIITNIGSAHIGELGGRDAIRDAKLEILEGLTVVVLNADDSFLMQGYESFVAQKGFNGRLITFSINNNSHVRAENVVVTDNGSSFKLRVKDGGCISINLNVYGLFNVYNSLAASAVCLSLRITIQEIKTALEAYKAFPMRFEVIRREKITLINDSYNANPSSMKESLKELVRMKGKGRTVAVLGDMSELGEFSESLHADVVKMAGDLGVDVFVAVGEMMSLVAEKMQKTINQSDESHLQSLTYTFKNMNEAKQNISRIIKDGDVVLVKGSRAMGMELIMENIRG